MTRGGIWVIEEFRWYVDGIDVIALNVHEAMLYAGGRVMADDGSLLADAARGSRRTSGCGHVNARVDAVLPQEPMRSGSTRFSGQGIDACGGTSIGSDNVSAVIDASGRRR